MRFLKAIREVLVDVPNRWWTSVLAQIAEQRKFVPPASRALYAEPRQWRDGRIKNLTLSS
jgi:hypothetical protein